MTARPLLARISRHALQHNYAQAKRRLRADGRAWAVVKANAYGHGLMRVVEALRRLADGFALVEIEAAIALRESGITQPILLLEGAYAADELALCAEFDLTLVVHSARQASQLCAAQLTRPLAVYLKLNSGMNRLGLNDAEFAEVWSALNTCANVRALTLMTHFADADDERGIDIQLAAFNALSAGRDAPLSLANSAALLRFPHSVASAGHWARPGIMLYGASPFPLLKSAADIGLMPVMTLTSRLIAVREIAAGERIGYGGAFVAEHSMRIGVVACGYADGYPRHAGSGTPVQVAGQRSRTLGRVSMDKLCVDLEGVADADVGSEVVLWGDGLPADEVAMSAGTVSYELFCALAARVAVVEI